MDDRACRPAAFPPCPSKAQLKPCLPFPHHCAWPGILPTSRPRLFPYGFVSKLKVVTTGGSIRIRIPYSTKFMYSPPCDTLQTGAARTVSPASVSRAPAIQEKPLESVPGKRPVWGTWGGTTCCTKYGIVYIHVLYR